MFTETRNNNRDIQGRFLGIPYDWRAPGWTKIRRRYWQPGGSMFVPKIFGWGWDLNLAHWGTWVLFGVILLTACAVVP